MAERTTYYVPRNHWWLWWKSTRKVIHDERLQWHCNEALLRTWRTWLLDEWRKTTDQLLSRCSGEGLWVLSMTISPSVAKWWFFQIDHRFSLVNFLFFKNMYFNYMTTMKCNSHQQSKANACFLCQIQWISPWVDALLTSNSEQSSPTPILYSSLLSPRSFFKCETLQG